MWVYYLYGWLLLGVINLFLYKHEFDSIEEELDWLEGNEIIILIGFLMLMVFSPYYFYLGIKRRILIAFENLKLKRIKRKVSKILKKENIDPKKYF